MAFSKQNWSLLSSALNLNVPRIWGYVDLNSTIATVSQSGYFDDISEEVTLDDLVYIRASDDAQLFRISSLDPVVISVLSHQKILMTRSFDVSQSAIAPFSRIYPVTLTGLVSAVRMTVETLVNETVSLTVTINAATVGSTFVFSGVNPPGITQIQNPTQDNLVVSGDQLFVDFVPNALEPGPGVFIACTLEITVI